MPKSKAKGNRGEKAVVELLKKYWDSEEFARNWMGGSGAVGTQLAGMKAKVPAHLLEAMTSDVVCPLDFPFCVESKCYKEVDLFEIVRNGPNSLVSGWWRQVRADAQRIGKMALVLFKEDRKQYFVLFSENDLADRIAKHKLDIPTLKFSVDGESVCLATWASFSSQMTKSILKEAKN